ncbi:ORF V: Enzymatic polyprotein [Labeo rohita]|uniref:ribonuclease H n=1 Tax=Labeo rohita TaxID=84645 RepID=A0ABQ8L6H3_LABRO|nr:ORF V: Enzymatic polyprotein [Labeo rohita]
MNIGEWYLHGEPLPRTYGYIRGRHATTHSDFRFGASSTSLEEKKKSSCELRSLSAGMLPTPKEPSLPFECTVVPRFSLGKPGSKRANFSRLSRAFFPGCLSGRALLGAVVCLPDGHDRCLTCLGREHAEAAFTDGSCIHCESMIMAALKSHRSFASRLPSLSSRGKSLSRQGFLAAVARHLGDIQVTMQNVPLASKAPRTSASPRGPVECPKQFASPRMWRAPFSSRSSSSPLATLDGGAARGYVVVPQVERAVSVHLCPWGAATWRDQPHLPSRACELSSALTGRAYHAAGQAATALHAMATLQARRLRATKATARSLGQMMSTVVVQERHLWLTLAQMADVDKARFLDAPISQDGLFGNTVEDFAQQFSAVQKQTEALKHIFPRRDSATTSAGPQPPPARHRGRPPASPKTPAPSPAEPRLAARRRRRASGTSQEHPQQSCEASLASASQPLAVVDSDSTSRLCNSVRQASAQVQRCPFHFCPLGHTCRCPACGGCSPTGEGCNRACPSSRDEVKVLQSLLHRAQKELWVKTHPGSSSFESVPSRAAVQNAHDEAHANMHPSPGLYKVLPFGLSLSPRVFTKVTEAALSPLWRMGIRILNYLDDWLLIAHSRDVLCEHRDLVLRDLSHLGLQVNREKSKLSPVQRISFLGVELDSVNMTARLTNERAQSVLNCLNSYRHKTAVPLKTFQRLLGHMAAAAAVTPLGLLHMRLLQHWLHDRVPRWPWHRDTHRIGVSLQCRRLFSPWSDPAFLQAGVPLGQVSRHLVVYTDASSTELLAVLLALRRFRPMLRHKHVLVRTDSTATVAYINHQGGLRFRRMSQLARHLLLWSQTWLKSLRAVHIPGELNRAADQLSRQSTHPGEWRLHPQRGSPRQGCAGTQLASGAQVRLSPSEPPSTDTVQDQGGRGAGSAGCAILAHPDLVSRPHFPCGSPSLEDPLEERPSFSGDGHNLAPASRPMEPARLAPGRDTSDLSGLSQAMTDTITQSRAPSTRQAYALRWGLFVDWCSSRGEDPQRCPIAVVLSFLQEKLERRLSPSTFKVYVAAIAAYHDAVDGASLGKHQLIVRFLRGARRVNSPRPHLVPSWDLSVTLQGLREAPFEPLASVELKHLSLKTALLTALASIKRVGDLQAFSVDEACLEFGPGDFHVILRPLPGYVLKVPTTPFRDQVVNLQALPLEASETRPLRCCVHQQKGNAVSKQRLAHWVVDAISLSYQNQGEPCPLGVHAHSTRSVASSYALAHGASLADICRAAGWATPNTFARFYNLRVDTVSSRVLT